MEGDAGASRLNPPPMSMLRRLGKRAQRPSRGVPEESDATDGQTSIDTTDKAAEVKAEDSAASEAATEQVKSDAKTQVAPAAKAESEQTGTEVKAEDSAEAEEAEESEAVEPAVARGRSRLTRGWLAGITAALLLAAGGIGFGGYLALRSEQGSKAIERNGVAALEAAKTCVAATQAPDTNAMAASEQKIIDCGTDEYRSQALLYTGMLVQAYQAANVHVQVTDERAAVERSNADGTIDVLVALRVRVSNSAAQNQETGYRLRVRMSPVDGQYKIAKLDQVTK